MSVLCDLGTRKILYNADENYANSIRFLLNITKKKQTLELVVTQQF